MGLEAATYVSQLVATNPVASDLRAQGDDHLRLIKAALQATFPNASRPFYIPETSAISASQAVVAADENTTFLVTTTGGAVTLTLPATAGLPAGWECAVMKVTTDTNPIFVQPASGTMTSGDQSGLSKIRRGIPNRKSRIIWTGSAWIAERVVTEPIGAVVPVTTASLPVGYEWPNGQTLNTSNYPEFAAANGASGVTKDLRGRVVAMIDNAGSAGAANRLTATGLGVAATHGNPGGAETHTLTGAQSGQKAISAAPVTISDPGHTHTTSVSAGATRQDGGSNTASSNAGVTGSSTTGITATFTLAASSASSAHPIVQPTMPMNMALVVE